MEEAMKSRNKAELELNEIAKRCVLLKAQLPDVEEEEYRAAITTFDEKLKAWDEAEMDVEMSAVDEEEQQKILEAAIIYRDGVKSCQVRLLIAWRKRAHPQNVKKIETPHPEQSVAHNTLSSTRRGEERMQKPFTSRTSAAAPYKPQQCAFYDGKLRSWICRM